MMMAHSIPSRNKARCTCTVALWMTGALPSSAASISNSTAWLTQPCARIGSLKLPKRFAASRNVSNTRPSLSGIGDERACDHGTDNSYSSGYLPPLYLGVPGAGGGSLRTLILRPPHLIQTKLRYLGMWMMGVSSGKPRPSTFITSEWGQYSASQKTRTRVVPCWRANPIVRTRPLIIRTNVEQRLCWRQLIFCRNPRAIAPRASADERRF
jgi:hypothetical protein